MISTVYSVYGPHIDAWSIASREAMSEGRGWNWVANRWHSDHI